MDGSKKNNEQQAKLRFPVLDFGALLHWKASPNFKGRTSGTMNTKILAKVISWKTTNCRCHQLKPSQDFSLLAEGENYLSNTPPEVATPLSFFDLFAPPKGPKEMDGKHLFPLFF